MFRHPVHHNGIDIYLLSQVDGTVERATIAEQPELAAITSQAERVATHFADFVGGAQHSLDVCIYDFRLVLDAVSASVVSAFNQAAERGVAVRIAYDKNETDDVDVLKKFEGAAGDPAPVGTSAFLRRAGLHAGVQVVPIAEEAIDPGSQIMHNKYMIRDAGTDHAGVWMGSTNFTVDAWALQENNIVVIANAPDLAHAYEQDFADLWTAQKITGTGAGDAATIDIRGVELGYNFAPGGGTAIESTIADAISAASTRVRIASMVLSSQLILTAIKNRIDAGIDVRGIYDYGETEQVRTAWQHHPADADKLALLDAVTEHLVAKKSLPFLQAHTDWAHNFMHNKIAVADNTVVTGSFNFSANATRNAENIITIAGPTTADAYGTYIEHLVSRYA